MQEQLPRRVFLRGNPANVGVRYANPTLRGFPLYMLDLVPFSPTINNDCQLLAEVLDGELVLSTQKRHSAVLSHFSHSFICCSALPTIITEFVPSQSSWLKFGKGYFIQ